VGKDGTPANNVLNPDGENRQLPSKFLLNVRKGDVFRTVLAGHGGWGDPLARDPELVCADARNEKMTPDYASREYGVVLDARTWTVDLQATDALRDRLRKERQEGSREPSPIPLASGDG
jgi:N-methylhydantoinase B